MCEQFSHESQLNSCKRKTKQKNVAQHCVNTHYGLFDLFKLLIYFSLQKLQKRHGKFCVIFRAKATINHLLHLLEIMFESNSSEMSTRQWAIKITNNETFLLLLFNIVLYCNNIFYGQTSQSLIGKLVTTVAVFNGQNQRRLLTALMTM